MIHNPALWYTSDAIIISCEKGAAIVGPEYIIVFVCMALFCLWQSPKEWWQDKKSIAALIVFHGIGMSSLIILLYFFWQLPDGWFRITVNITETIYFSLLLFGTAFLVIRLIGFYTLRHFMPAKTAAKLFSLPVYLSCVIALAAAFVVVGMRNIDELDTVSYDVVVQKASADGSDAMRVAVLGDIHVGAGASQEQLDRMTDAVNASRVDAVLVVGDVSDSASSANDVASMAKAFQKMNSTYGVYYVRGNHEAEAHIDSIPDLEAAGVFIINDEAVTLPNGVVLVGRDDPREVPIDTIKARAEADPDAPSIVLQHRPSHLADNAPLCDITVCGHTHGAQFPFVLFYQPLLEDMTYGIEKFDNMYAITTSGVSAWGFYAKWPSVSEIAVVNMVFTNDDKAAWKQWNL